MARKLMPKKYFDNMVKAHNQMGSYAFSNSVKNIDIDIECDYKDGNEIKISNVANDKCESCKFGFEDLTYEKFEGYILELKKEVTKNNIIGIDLGNKCVKSPEDMRGGA
jgi:hypothetical protein